MEPSSNTFYKNKREAPKEPPFCNQIINVGLKIASNLIQISHQFEHRTKFNPVIIHIFLILPYNNLNKLHYKDHRRINYGWQW